MLLFSLIINNDITVSFQLLAQNGDTVLMIAAENGHDAVVRVLLKEGANPSLQDKVSCE